MKVKYRYQVKGNLIPDIVFPLHIENSYLEFVLEKHKIVAIEITEAIPTSSGPKLITSSTPPVLELGGANPNKFKSALKLAEGLLAFFGLDEILTDEVEIIWIAENETEKKLIPINNFTYKKEPIPINDPISFDLIARPFIAGFINNNNYEVALSFYRQGKNDMRMGKYIEAFYDFYFLIESTYGNGKSKNTAIEENFLKSESLITAINTVKNDVSIVDGMSDSIKSNFLNNYQNRSANEIIKHIISIRGFLHHHNKKHPKPWSPDHQDNYQIDSIFLMYVCHTTVWDILETYIYDHKVQMLYSNHYKAFKKIP